MYYGKMDVVPYKHQKGVAVKTAATEDLLRLKSSVFEKDEAQIIKEEVDARAYAICIFLKHQKPHTPPHDEVDSKQKRSLAPKGRHMFQKHFFILSNSEILRSIIYRTKLNSC